MFGHLVIKEWKERRALVVFAVVVLAGFAIASAAWAREREAPEILLGALSLVFLPVFGALLGSTGFEAEFRNGAWTYLLSRPVKKATIWLAKFLALFSTLVLVGALSFFVVSVSPRLRAAASTLTAPGLGGPREPLVSMLVVGFGLALLTFALAFAMSLLTERAITVTAVSLFLGFVIYGGWLYGYAAVRYQFLWDLDFSMIWAGMLLTGLGALLASLQTFRKADFSQPRRKAGFFWLRASVLFVLAVVIVAVLGVWPRVRGRYISFECAEAGNLYFTTSGGSFVYSASEDRTKRLRLPVAGRYIYLASARAGKLLGYEAWRRYESLFIARADGSEKIALTGPKAKDPRLREHMTYWGPLLSPDGRAAVLCTWPGGRPGKKNPDELWLINDQGEVVKHQPAVLPELATEDYYSLYVYPAAWPKNGNLILFNLRRSIPSRETRNDISVRRSETRDDIMAWDIDRNELRLLAKDASLSSYYRSAAEDIIPARRRSADGTGWTLSLFDLKTATLSDVWTETNLEAQLASVSYGAAWSPEARKMAFLVERDSPPLAVLGLYGVNEQKITGQRNMNPKDVGFTELTWTADGRELVIKNSGRRGLEFFNERLEPTRFAAFPEGDNFYGLKLVGDKLLMCELRANRLWRLDLKTEKWKRIY